MSKLRSVDFCYLEVILVEPGFEEFAPQDDAGKEHCDARGIALVK